MKGLVYTAIIGDRDRPLRRRVKEHGVDYLMFTDRSAPKGWEEVRVGSISPRRARYTARNIKIMLPDQAKGYDWALWVDGSHVPQRPIARHVEEWLESKDFAAYRHHGWSCTYKEISQCAKLGKDRVDRLSRASRLLEDAGFPRGYGQIATTVLARRVSSQLVREHMAEWWGCIDIMSIRDQVSFMYCLWRLTGRDPAESNLHYIGPNAFRNELFHYQGGH